MAQPKPDLFVQPITVTDPVTIGIIFHKIINATFEARDAAKKYYSILKSETLHGEEKKRALITSKVAEKKLDDLLARLSSITYTSPDATHEGAIPNRVESIQFLPLTNDNGEQYFFDPKKPLKP